MEYITHYNRKTYNRNHLPGGSGPLAESGDCFRIEFFVDEGHAREEADVGCHRIRPHTVLDLTVLLAPPPQHKGGLVPQQRRGQLPLGASNGEEEGELDGEEGELDGGEGELDGGEGE